MSFSVITTISDDSTVIMASSVKLSLFFTVNCLSSGNLALLLRNVIGANVLVGDSEKFSAFVKYSSCSVLVLLIGCKEVLAK